MVTLLLGGVFLVSAYLKAVKPAETITSLGMLFGDQDVPARVALYGLVFGEMILAAALLANVAPRRTLFVTIGVLAVFTVWIARLLAIGWTGGCGCGSWTPTLDPTLALWISLGRNLLLLALAGAAFSAARRHVGHTLTGEDPQDTHTATQGGHPTDHAQTSAFDV